MRTRLLNFFFVCLLFISSGAAIKIKAAKGEQSKPKGTKGQKSSPVPTPAPTTTGCVEDFKAVLEEASGRSVVVNSDDGWIGGVFTNTTDSTSFEAPPDCFCEVKVLSTGGGAGGGRSGGGGGAGATNECTIDEEDSKNGGTFVITVGKAGKGGTVGCGGSPFTCPSGGDGGSTLITGPNGFSCEAAGGGGGGGGGRDGTKGVDSTSTGGKGGHGGGGGATDGGTSDGGAEGVPGGNVGGKGRFRAGGGGAGADGDGSDGVYDDNFCNTLGCLGGNGGNGTAVQEPFLEILQEILGSEDHLWLNQTKVAAGGGGAGFDVGGMGGEGGGGGGYEGISGSPCTDAHPPYTGSGGGGGGVPGCNGAGGAITLVFTPCP